MRAFCSQSKAGQLSVDILVRYIGTSVVAFHLMMGRGFSRKGVAGRVKRFGVDIVEIRVFSK